MPASQLAAEALAAVTGVDLLLDPTPKPVSPAQGEKAIGLPKRWRTMLEAFVEAPGFKDQGDEPAEYDYFETKDRLFAMIPPSRVEVITAAIDDRELADAYAAVLDRGVAFLRRVFPSATMPSLFGPQPIEPPKLEEAAFWRAWEAVNDPEAIVRDLGEGILVTDEVMAMQACHPNLYDAVQMTILGLLAEHRAKDADWDLPLRKQRQVEILLNVSAVSPEFAQELQAMNAAARNEKKSLPTEPLDLDIKNIETPTQRWTQK